LRKLAFGRACTRASAPHGLCGAHIASACADKTVTGVSCVPWGTSLCTGSTTCCSTRGCTSGAPCLGYPACDRWLRPRWLHQCMHPLYDFLLLVRSWCVCRRPYALCRHSSRVCVCVLVHPCVCSRALTTCWSPTVQSVHTATAETPVSSSSRGLSSRRSGGSKELPARARSASAVRAPARRVHGPESSDSVWKRTDSSASTTPSHRGSTPTAISSTTGRGRGGGEVGRGKGERLATWHDRSRRSEVVDDVYSDR
jgi:hypothetical protein